MRFVSYSKGTGVWYGLLVDQGVLDLPQASGGALPNRLAGLIAAGPATLATVRQLAEQGGSTPPVEQLRLTAPIPDR